MIIIIVSLPQLSFTVLISFFISMQHLALQFNKIYSGNSLLNLYLECNCISGYICKDSLTTADRATACIYNYTTIYCIVSL